jgi:threonine aldolase
MAWAVEAAMHGSSLGPPRLISGVALFPRPYYYIKDLLNAPSGDVVTTPTPSMLLAIQNTTLLDDVFNEDITTQALESHVAALTSHPSALFVLSGTMGNQLAFRSHLLQPPHSILCDHRAHVLTYEAGGAASLSGALIKGVVPKNGLYLTLEDIENHVDLSEDVHACPTRIVSLENTLGGSITPLAETKRISAFARQHNLKLHLDGARLWEAVAAGAGTLPEYTSLFDSVSLCFSKGLGAPIGSILIGSKPFIKHARWVRKSLGGGIRQSGVITAAARVAVDETFGLGPTGEGGLLRGSHKKARLIAEKWASRGGKLQKPVETNMVWLDLKALGISAEEFMRLGEMNGIRLFGGRLVVHYQISDEAVGRLERVMDGVFEIAKGNTRTRERSVGGERIYGN